ncbi:DNA-directed RNA polymerase subunit E'' [Candidatus Woesearchaeota archaeon]|nr:DNA-directed RNA polymerase subunit E'' [Candidatus Woesearchaeota archaeon]
MRKQACRTCKILFEGETCPLCKKKTPATVWQGRIHFLNSKKSNIADKMGVEKEGEYAIKVR